MEEESRREIERLQQMIDESQKIVFFGGAGVSTESGIPDFRSADGLYQQNYKYTPEQVVSHSFFVRNPEAFYEFYKEKMMFLEAEPNPAHEKLAQLEHVGKLTAVITQNIDGLHQKAGSEQVLELHGSIHRNYCQKCGKFYDAATVKEADAVITQNIDGLHQKAGSEQVLELHGSIHRNYCQKCGKFYDAATVKEAEGIPRCICGGIIKPDVVLYEEGLDSSVIRRAIRAISEADMLIIGGTSLVVYPAAGFIDYFRGKYLVVINKSETARTVEADLCIRRPIGEVFAQIQL